MFILCAIVVPWNHFNVHRLSKSKKIRCCISYIDSLMGWYNLVCLSMRIIGALCKPPDITIRIRRRRLKQVLFYLSLRQPHDPVCNHCIKEVRWIISQAPQATPCGSIACVLMNKARESLALFDKSAHAVLKVEIYCGPYRFGRYRLRSNIHKW